MLRRVQSASLRRSTFSLASALRTYSKVPLNPQPPKLPGDSKPSSGPNNLEETSKKVGQVIPPKRKPTVAEEIAYTKLYDIKRFVAFVVGILFSKVVYDFYSNYIQNKLYEDPNVLTTIWNQVAEDIWIEGINARVVVQRFGRDLQLDGDKRVAKRRQIRYWNTFEYVAEALMFMFRFRHRIWEDIGTVELMVPVKGSAREGTLHVRAYTRDRKWIVEKAWLEDAEMIIELKRRISLDFLLNPEPELLIEFDKNRR